MSGDDRFSEMARKYATAREELKKRPDVVMKAVRFVDAIRKRCRSCTAMLGNQPDILAVESYESKLCEPCKRVYERVMLE